MILWILNSVLEWNTTLELILEYYKENVSLLHTLKSLLSLLAFKDYLV
jgi:hypothetical protein